MNAIAAWRRAAGHAPLRLLRNDRVSPGHRTRRLLAVGTLSLGIIASAGLAAALLPADMPAGLVHQAVVEQPIAGNDVALALQAAGAFSGPLPGRDRPALRFGASPVPLPELPFAEPSLSASLPEPAPAAATRSELDGGAIGAATAEDRRASSDVIAAVETRVDPIRITEPPAHRATAADPSRPVARPHPRVAATSTARPHRVAIEARQPERLAMRPPVDPTPSWTLPSALAPTTP